MEGTQNMLREQYWGVWGGGVKLLEQLLHKTRKIEAIYIEFPMISQNFRLAPSALARRPLTNLGVKRGKQYPFLRAWCSYGCSRNGTPIF